MKPCQQPVWREESGTAEQLLRCYEATMLAPSMLSGQTKTLRAKRAANRTIVPTAPRTPQHRQVSLRYDKSKPTGVFRQRTGLESQALKKVQGRLTYIGGVPVLARFSVTGDDDTSQWVAALQVSGDCIGQPIPQSKQSSSFRKVMEVNFGGSTCSQCPNLWQVALRKQLSTNLARVSCS